VRLKEPTEREIARLVACFNSLKVRLKVYGALAIKQSRFISFNSLKVRLKAGIASAALLAVIGFNSLKVRLKDGDTVTLIVGAVMFQFLKGAIKRG